jgi:hypothetical protein
MPVLNAVVAKHNIEHWAQYPLLDGAIVQGYPDWALIHDKKPIFIIEDKGKTKIDMKAIAQLVLQLYEAYMRMKPDDDTSEWAMYGMVTTAVEAVFVKALSFVRGM